MASRDRASGRVAVVCAVGLAACKLGPLGSVAYMTPPGGSDTTTGFSGITEALTALRAAHREHTRHAAPPIALTASDGEGLVLRGIHARAVIDGPLAVTELHLTFENPEARTREGRFTIALPDGAAISRLAMQIGGKWMEGEVVARMRAREVYEAHMRPVPTDPALLERDAGNVFSARVFPIEAHETKQLIVTYSEEVSATRPYRLHLAGLPAVDELDVEVNPGAGAPIAQRGHGQAPDDIVIPTTGADALVARHAVVVRLAPDLQSPADPLTDATVLVDTSASRGPGFRAQAEAVRDLVRALQSRGLERVEVAAFDQGVTTLASGAPDIVADGIVDALIARGALGASDLGAALTWAAARRTRVIVVGDGIATAGATDPAGITAAGHGAPRIDAVVLGGRSDREALLAAVGAGAHPGVILDEADRDRWADRLGRGVLAAVPIQIPGAAWVWPARLESIQPGDEAVVMAQMIAEVPAALEIRLGDHVLTVPTRPAPDALVGRAVAGAEIARLRRTLPAAGTARDQALATMTELALQNRLLTDETGLLVLQSEDEYDGWCLDRSALADILTLDAGAITVVDRSGGAAPRVGCGPVDTSTTGPTSISGVIRDKRSGELLIGATVVAVRRVNSPQGEQVAITDEYGHYWFRGLARGTYDLTIYYLDSTMERRGIEVGPTSTAATTLDHSPVTSFGPPGGELAGVQLATASAAAPAFHDGGASADILIPESYSAGEAVMISAEAPTIDPTSTEQHMVTPSTADLGPRTGEDYRGPPLPTHRVHDWSPPSAPGGGKPAWSGRYAGILASSRAGAHDRAIGDAVRWQTSAPGDLLAVLALGEALEAGGHPGLAARAYGSILDLYPHRAEMARAAGERLDRVGGAGAALAIDAYRRAVADRPDQGTGARLLAWALVRAGDLDAAFAALESGIRDAEWASHDTLVADLGMVAAAMIERHPDQRYAITRRTIDAGGAIATQPTVRFVLSWETDASNVDLHVLDRKDHRAWAEHPELGKVGEMQVAGGGWGPESFAMNAAEADQGPYRLAAYLADPGPQGYTLGTVQVIEHDGRGGFLFAHRPFVITEPHSYVDLGTWR